MTLDSIRNSCDVFAICVTTVIALNGVLKHRPPLLQLGGPLDFLYFLFSWMFLLKYLTFISFLSQYQMWRGWVEREAKQGGGVSRLLPPDPPGRFLTTRLDNFFDNSTRSTRQKFNKSVSLETLSSATLDLAIKVRLRVKSVILIIIMLDLIQWWMSILFDRDGASSSGCLQPHLCLPRGGGFWPRLVSNNFEKMKQFSN